MYNNATYNKPTALRARADIEGGQEAPELRGEMQFFQRSDGVLVTAQVFGLPTDSASGFFGLHIHEGDSCGGADFGDTGGHYDPAGVPHPRHAGDLPPLLSCQGRAYLAVLTDRFTVADIIDRTVVIHSGSDDFRSQPAGDAGAKIACGVIRRG